MVRVCAFVVSTTKKRTESPAVAWELRGGTEPGSVPPAPQGTMPLAELTRSPDRVTVVSKIGCPGHTYHRNPAEYQGKLPGS